MGLREQRMSNTSVSIKKLSPELKEIYDSFIMPVDLNIDLDRVILSAENKEKYMRLIKETEYSDKLVEFGLKPTNRVLLYGASGTGKTFSTKAIANYLGYTMLYVDIGEALSSGNIAKNVKDIFRIANEIKNCIVFLDECDSIAYNREEAVGDDASMLRRATNAIFQAMDNMDYRIIVFAASNLESKLDAAFIRRFNLKMRFNKPDMELKECVKHFIYPKFTLIDDVDSRLEDIVNRRAKQNARLSYYEIEEMVYRGMKDAILSDSEEVHTQDIFIELAKSMNINIKFICVNADYDKKSSPMDL